MSWARSLTAVFFCVIPCTSLLMELMLSNVCSAQPTEPDAASVAQSVAQWDTFTIELTAAESYPNPYTDVDVWGVFRNAQGVELRRPAFWDGGNSWKIRFAPPDSNGRWNWSTHSSNRSDAGLHGTTGVIQSISRSTGDNSLRGKGLLKMSAGTHSVIHHDGAPFLMVGDTPWSIPFRATLEQVELYAQDRRSKGFNTALLATVQPDAGAQGPDERNTVQGFKRAFGDLPSRHLNELNPEYFQTLDHFVDTLLEHDMVPVYAVMLHGYGWKGQQVVGNWLDEAEVARYARYLLARYGSAPAMWLLTVDGAGNAPGVAASGVMLEEWDCYGQPTGIHYNPCDDFIAKWAVDLEDPLKYCMHGNKRHQAEAWLDFQWAQTGHEGLHLYHKVAGMYDNLPTKAVANGEPTYEGMENGLHALGWWQGEEAWMQLMSGGTMGVVYGAASVWRWKITADETGWESWTDEPRSWQQSLEHEGSNYVGLLGQILDSRDLTDIERRPDLAGGSPLLAHPGKLYIAYLNTGGAISIQGVPPGMSFSWIDPRTGTIAQQGLGDSDTWTAPSNDPWVLIIE